MFSRLKKLESTFHMGQATLIIASFTLLSRLTGFARDVLLASHLGAGADSDIYFTAFRLPDLVYNLLIFGTLSVAFIPVFSEYYFKDKSRAFDIASTVANFASLGMAALCLLAFIFAVPLTHLLAPGFPHDELIRTAAVTRIMLLSPIIFTFSIVWSSVLISLKKFLVVNIAPLLYNLGIIIGILVLYPRYGVAGLAYGVIFGALMHIGIQIPEAWRYGFSWKPRFNYSDPAVKKIGKLFLPRIVGLDNSYVNLIIVSIIGSTLASGSIAAFNYANNIQAVALGIFALSSAVAIFPVLTEYFAKGSIVDFIKTLQQTMIRVLYFVVPITILLLLLRAHVVRLLLGYGRCDWNCTIITFNALGILALGLVAQSLIPLLARAFYARHNTKTPVLISLVGMAINILLSFLFAKALGVVGIALGFVVASTVQCILLFVYLHRAFAIDDKVKETELQVFSGGLVLHSSKIVFASVLMGTTTYIFLYVVAIFVDTHTVVGIFLQASIATTAGGAIYIAITHFLGIRESQAIAKSGIKFIKAITGSKA